jgi:hypothetical protein
MYRKRKLKFHNGKDTHGLKGYYQVQTYLFTSYIMKLCDEANKVTRTEFIGVKSDEDNNWTITIKTMHKAYFNLIAQRFVTEFNEVISQIKY